MVKISPGMGKHCLCQTNFGSMMKLSDSNLITCNPYVYLTHIKVNCWEDTFNCQFSLVARIEASEDLVILKAVLGALISSTMKHV